MDTYIYIYIYKYIFVHATKLQRFLHIVLRYSVSASTSPSKLDFLSQPGGFLALMLKRQAGDDWTRGVRQWEKLKFRRKTVGRSQWNQETRAGLALGSARTRWNSKISHFPQLSVNSEMIIVVVCDTHYYSWATLRACVHGHLHTHFCIYIYIYESFRFLYVSCLLLDSFYLLLVRS